MKPGISQLVLPDQGRHLHGGGDGDGEPFGRRSGK
jgi:hypothetical protein